MPGRVQARRCAMTCATDRAKPWDSKGFMSKYAQMKPLCRHGSYSCHALQCKYLPCVRARAASGRWVIVPQQQIQTKIMHQARECSKDDWFDQIAVGVLRIGTDDIPFCCRGGQDHDWNGAQVVACLYLPQDV